MTRRPDPHGFTIVELLVVVSIIALLLGLLLPAIGEARDRGKMLVSQSNLRNLATAHAAYAATYNDRHLTFVNDRISTYGDNSCDAFSTFAGLYGPIHPNVVLGWGIDPGGDQFLWQYFLNGEFPGHACWAGNPIHWDVNGFGQFRFGHQTRTFSPFLNGRYYDPVFFAPKDTILMEIVEPGFTMPHEFASIPADDDLYGSVLYTSSYCLSPAAMYAPEVLRPESEGGFQPPWLLDAGLRCPSMSQARYSDLKTHMLEHQWLQNARLYCNPGFSSPGTYQGCEPFFFNHGFESVPMTMFYDGHVEGLGTREAMQADTRHTTQTGDGLWSRDTPFGPDGYFIEFSYDFTETSYHILTTNGIQGRDTFDQ